MITEDQKKTVKMLEDDLAASPNGKLPELVKVSTVLLDALDKEDKLIVVKTDVNTSSSSRLSQNIEKVFGGDYYTRRKIKASITYSDVFIDEDASLPSNGKEAFKVYHKENVANTDK